MARTVVGISEQTQTPGQEICKCDGGMSHFGVSGVCNMWGGGGPNGNMDNNMKIAIMWLVDSMMFWCRNHNTDKNTPCVSIV